MGDEYNTERLTEIIDQVHRDGVTVSLSRPHRVTGIQWRPGTRNMLAEVIIDDVGDDEILLDLGGHEYLIRKK